MKVGATFYNNPNGSTSDFAAVNAMTINYGNSMNVNNGGSVNYQISNAGKFNFNADSNGVKGSVVQSPTFSMTDFTKPLDALQSQLSKLSANSTVNSADANHVKFVETGTTAVFSLTTTMLQEYRGIEFVGTASTIIINVTGKTFDDTFNFPDYPDGLAGRERSSKIIWNFEDAESISLRGWEGSILAGNATVSASSRINGVLYAEDYTGNGELHSVAFTGALPAVPEPETYAMLLAGLGLMGCVARRKKSV